MTEINKKLLYTLEDRFDKLQAYLDRVYQFEQNEDLYSFIAHIMYDKDIDECREMNPDGTPNPDGKKLRDRAKQFILPVVVECGGISDDTDEITDAIQHHRDAAVNFRDCVHSYTPKNDYEKKNAEELLDQALKCDQIANWLEEFLILRSGKEHG